MTTERDARREVEAPDDLRRAVRRSRAATAAWSSFPPSHRRKYVEWVEEAKRPQTRARRVARAVEMMASKAPRS